MFSSQCFNPNPQYLILNVLILTKILIFQGEFYDLKYAKM
jgi:hypothetical protein